MLLLNVVLVLSLAASTTIGARLPDARRFRCDDVSQGNLCRGIQDSNKERRGATLGMFPHPRTGRSQPERTWLFSPQDYAELHNEMKRQGLIPFPRVGRAMDDSRKNEATTGMWFGPRLGRFPKKSLLAQPDPWTMAALRDLSGYVGSRYGREQDFTPRLGREEEDELAEDQLDQQDVARSNQ